MATTVARPRSAGRAGHAHPRRRTPAKTVAKTPAKALVKAAAPGGSGLARQAGWKLAKVMAGRGWSSGRQLSGQGLERAATSVVSLRQKVIDASSTSVEADTDRRPPIHAAVDAAVPGRVAWQEWMRLEWLPEGVDRVLELERDGDDQLSGRVREPDGGEWEARILDEREEESFAWESTRGSDCAGLITFHELGARLTRIELSLDIRPVSVAQAVALATRRADRRAAADLRRFKARLELINPDAYPDRE